MMRRYHFKKVVQTEQGFSLLEMLIVLCITFTIVGAFSAFSFKYISEFNDEQLMYQVQAKIREAQFVGYVNGRAHALMIHKDIIFATYAERDRDWLHAQFLPPTVRLIIQHASELLPREPHINSNMNLSGIGELVFHTRRGYDRFTMHLGKGRITHAYSTK